MSNRLLFRLILLILLIVLGIYLFIYYDLHSFFYSKQKIIEFVQYFGPLSALIFIGLQVLQVIISPIPGEFVGLIGGYLFGFTLGTIYSTIGLTIGSWLAFMLARYFGLPLVERIVKASVLQKYDHFMEHRGAFVSFILFLIPGFPKDYLCYIMGLSHMGTRTFIIISTAGRLLGTAILSVFGSGVRNNQYVLVAAILAVSAILLLITYFYRDKLLQLIKEIK